MPAAEPAAERSILPWLIGGALLLGALAFLFLRRRRRLPEEEYQEAYYDEPVAEPVPMPMMAAAAPVAAAPIAAAPMVGRFDESAPVVQEEIEVARAAEPVAEVDAVDVGEADSADVAALAADSPTVSDRPWLEFLMRPIRAGTTADETRVEFELTVGNTGATEARDVRISSWMFSAGSAQESEMERMLIDPPAEAQISQVTIAAGDGAKVEAAIALPKAGLNEPVLPVVVADARYTLPDGSEGRTTAAFEVGLPEGEALAPFPADRSSGLLEAVGARLHGEPERT